MRTHVLRATLAIGAIVVAVSVGAAGAIAQSRVDAHVAAAKAAAGTDFAGVFNRICTEAVPPATPATPARGPRARAGSPGTL